MSLIKKIGILGCGAIGSEIARLVRQRLAKSYRIQAVCDTDSQKIQLFHRRFPSVAVCDRDELVRRCDLIVEAASARVSYQVARECLAAGRDILIMSVGGILGREKGLFALARRNGARILFPSGAICGVDGIRAAGWAGLEAVTLRTSKPPRSLEGAPYLVDRSVRLSALKKKRCVFRGSAREAVAAFPQNINVVAVLSLACRGQVIPRVEIWACPGIGRNVHEIDIRSKAGSIHIRCENTPSPENPKTSYLAIVSAVEALASVAGAARVGS